MPRVLTRGRGLLLYFSRPSTGEGKGDRKRFGYPRAVAQIDFMLRQAQHERKSHMISRYRRSPRALRLAVRPEVLEG